MVWILEVSAVVDRYREGENRILFGSAIYTLLVHYSWHSTSGSPHFLMML
jgi:hypothetical protein